MGNLDCLQCPQIQSKTRIAAACHVNHMLILSCHHENTDTVTKRNNEQSRNTSKPLYDSILT